MSRIDEAEMRYIKARNAEVKAAALRQMEQATKASSSEEKKTKTAATAASKLEGSSNTAGIRGRGAAVSSQEVASAKDTAQAQDHKLSQIKKALQTGKIEGGADLTDDKGQLVNNYLIKHGVGDIDASTRAILEAEKKALENIDAIRARRDLLNSNVPDLEAKYAAASKNVDELRPSLENQPVNSEGGKKWKELLTAKEEAEKALDFAKFNLKADVSQVNYTQLEAEIQGLEAEANKIGAKLPELQTKAHDNPGAAWFASKDELRYNGARDRMTAIEKRKSELSGQRDEAKTLASKHQVEYLQYFPTKADAYEKSRSEKAKELGLQDPFAAGTSSDTSSPSSSAASPSSTEGTKGIEASSTSNSTTPATKEAEVETEPKAGKSYKIKPGDTLWDIAEAVYGDGMAWKKIYEANRSEIKDPDLIYPDQVFKLPSLDVAVVKAKRQATQYGEAA